MQVAGGGLGGTWPVPTKQIWLRRKPQTSLGQLSSAVALPETAACFPQAGCLFPTIACSMKTKRPQRPSTLSLGTRQGMRVSS